MPERGKFLERTLENGVVLRIPLDLVDKMILKGIENGIGKFYNDVDAQVCQATVGLVQERAKVLIKERHKVQVENAAIEIAKKAIDALAFITPSALRSKK